MDPARHSDLRTIAHELGHGPMAQYMGLAMGPDPVMDWAMDPARHGWRVAALPRGPVTRERSAHRYAIRITEEAEAPPPVRKTPRGRVAARPRGPSLRRAVRPRGPVTLEYRAVNPVRQPPIPAGACRRTGAPSVRRAGPAGSALATDSLEPWVTVSRAHSLLTV